MLKNKFKLPPVSPLIGGSLTNFNRVIYGKRIDPPYRYKLFLTRLIILLLSPVRLYNRFILKFKNLRSIDDIDPVFVLGHWRSGTTYIHNLLCQDPASAYVSTFQSVFPNYLASRRLLKPIMLRAMPSKRPGDNIKLAPDKPQEDEFALSNSSEYSFYNFFYFPKHIGEYYHKYVRFDTNELVKKNYEDTYQQILQYAMLGKPDKSRIILKNPVNTARLDFLTKKFPSATYIHVYRNPYVVFLSTKKFFSELLPTLWLQEIDESDMEKMIIDLYLNIYDDYFEFRKRNPDFKILEVAFEDFESDPMTYLKQFYESYLQKDFDEIKVNFTNHIEKNKSYKKNRYEMSRKEFELISEKWSKYIELWKYQLPPDVKIIE